MNPDDGKIDLAGGVERWQKTIWAELGLLMRVKKLEPVPASHLPLLAQLLGVHESDEGTGKVLRSRLKTFLEELATVEGESEATPLAKPAMVLFGFTPRSAHKKIGARRKLAAPLRGVAISTMPRQEIAIAREVGLCLILRNAESNDD